MTTNTGETAPSDGERHLAARLFDEAWALLDKPERSAEEDDRLVHLAHASRLHWDNVGNDQHRAVGEWQIARVYSAREARDRAVAVAEGITDPEDRQVVAADLADLPDL